MRINDLRNAFISYFENQGHKHIHSSPLVPQNDPTLMFANSGMVQFKNVFTGLESRDYKRAVTAQKCIRAGGKHNDLENVGYTLRHHTFFEMLGNFSFGDYFKEDAIEYAWKFITSELAINKDKLCVTIYHDDEQAYESWKKVAGLSDDRIIRISTKDNFWSMGETGPCGPCSEIFYDHGDQFNGKLPSEADETGDRFVEIWNLVFMQFEQLNSNERIDLPKPSIDTGMGIERIAAVMQGTNDNYQVDSIKEIIGNSIELTKSDDDKLISSHRVIADHLRSSCFLIADGVLPSNEGRGYVLRRIMRRAMRHVHLLDYNDTLMHQLVPTLMLNMKEAYPELLRAEILIKETLKYEEEKFKNLLDKGISQLDNITKDLRSGDTFPGDSAFKLYDTYGFPIDLTQDILRSNNISIDIDGFNKKLEAQKELARKNWSGAGGSVTDKIWFELNKELLATEFLGYNGIETQGEVLSIIKEDKRVAELKEKEEGIIMLNQTVFYAESGGQIGDTGVIQGEDFEFSVMDTQKKDKLILHIGVMIKGTIKNGSNAVLSVNQKQRNDCKAYHSATHILHQSLRDRLGEHVTQKGSLVSNDKLRFDFSHHKSMTNLEIEDVQNKVNEVIKTGSKVETLIMSPDDAVKAGALALFGEKYSGEVRVLKIGKFNDKTYSTELCGGTHVSNTNEIGELKIVSESSAASGVRRIEALRGDDLLKFNEEKKREDLKSEEKKQDIKKEKEASTENIRQLKEAIELSIGNNSDHNIIIEFCENVLINELRPLIDKYKKQISDHGVIILCAKKGDKLSFLIGVTDQLTDKIGADEIAKFASSISNGKGGGGRKDFAQSGGTLINEDDQKRELRKFIIGKLQ
ncbi:alanine--tRNA ligase [Pelagibacteraceae bacterium]|nr:alanine--tRNA ligase [Pelagibacteraceae bacterium]